MSSPSAPAPLVVQDVRADAAGRMWSLCLDLLALRRSGAARPGRLELRRAASGAWSLHPGEPDGGEPDGREPDGREPDGREQGTRLVLDLDGALGQEPAELAERLGPSVAVYSAEAFRAGANPIRAEGALPAAELAFLSLYLPPLLGAWRAPGDPPFVLGHLAQSIDGRIACENGQSQWISNTANLHHAHRLRALHDGVLVGARTVTRDNPRLTVRHVRGASPRRVLLSGSASVLQSSQHHVFDADGSLVVCASGAEAQAGVVPEGSRLLSLEPDERGRLLPRTVVEALSREGPAGEGLGSLFVEGGGACLSGFLEDGALDVLHVHVAPIVLGSGVPGFRLPTVDRVGRAPRFAVRHFLLDGELLMECRRVAGDEPA